MTREQFKKENVEFRDALKKRLFLANKELSQANDRKRGAEARVKHLESQIMKVNVKTQ